MMPLFLTQFSTVKLSLNKDPHVTSIMQQQQQPALFA